MSTPRLRGLAHVDQGPAQRSPAPWSCPPTPSAPPVPRPGPGPISARRGGGTPILTRKASRSPASAVSPMVRGARPPSYRIADRGEGGGRIAVGDGAEQVVGGGVERRHLHARRHAVERGERVAHRPGPGLHHVVDHVFAHVESGVGRHVAHVLGHEIVVEQAQFEHLAAAPDRLRHFVGLGGGHHPGDVRGGAPPGS